MAVGATVNWLAKPIEFMLHSLRWSADKLGPFLVIRQSKVHASDFGQLREPRGGYA